MLDHVRPLTGVLAATCLWALALLVLAVAGLGGQVTPLPDDPALVRALPGAKLKAVEARLGPAADYAEVGNRPLLLADRRPAPVTPVAGEGSTDLDVALTSVLMTPRLQMAILTDNQGGASRRVKVGESVPGSAWRLVAVEPRRAMLEGPGGQRVLELRVFTGGVGAGPDGGVAAEGSPVPPEGGATPVPAPAPDPNVASAPVPDANAGTTLTQEQQIEAIRKRIEARRAQMRAEAAKAAGDKR
jgi:general secretion pathway protein N